MTLSTAPQPRVGRPRFATSTIEGPDLLSELIHKIGHEIGNPLTAIISLSTIVERFDVNMDSAKIAPLAEKLGGYGRSMTAEAWRISLLTERLVMLLSLRPPNLGPVNLIDVADRAIRRVRSRYSLPEVELLSNVSLSEPITVRFDQEQLLVLISELLLNAFQVVAGESSLPPTPSTPPSVSLFVRSSGETASLIIRNEVRSAIPIPLEDLFDPMISAVGDHKRIGLGLTVCAVIVNRCGGAIRVVEEPQASGVSFLVEVTLPL